LVFRGFSRKIAQPLEQSGREMSKGRCNRPRFRANHNSRSVNGAYPARLRESLGCKTSIAPLQALDCGEPRGERLEFVVLVEKPCDGFGHRGEAGRGGLNIILVSDSLAKSRSIALSQAQVMLIAFGILVAGFLLAMATYVVTMKFAVDLRNPYLRTL